jgi:hypothetical protein
LELGKIGAVVDVVVDGVVIAQVITGSELQIPNSKFRIQMRE